MPPSQNHADSAFTAPERNHYFYGLLLNEAKFTRETDYFNLKRWLLNRLCFGSGILFGLETTVQFSPDTIIVQPGVAIDRLGREILVPDVVSLPFANLADES